MRNGVAKWLQRAVSSQLRAVDRHRKLLLFAATRVECKPDSLLLDKSSFLRLGNALFAVKRAGRLPFKPQPDMTLQAHSQPVGARQRARKQHIQLPSSAAWQTNCPYRCQHAAYRYDKEI